MLIVTLGQELAGVSPAGRPSMPPAQEAASYTTAPGAATITVRVGATALGAAEALDRFRFSELVFMDAIRNNHGQIVIRLRARRADSDGGFCSFQSKKSALWIHPDATVFEIQAALMRAQRAHLLLHDVTLLGAHTVLQLARNVSP